MLKELFPVFPLRSNILFDVGLKWVRRTHKKHSDEGADKRAQPRWQTRTNIFKSHLHCTKRQIGRSAFSLTPCIHLPLLPLKPTYTIRLHTKPWNPPRTDGFIWHIFIPFVLSSARCESFCDALDTVAGIFFFSKLKKNIKTLLLIIARFIKKTNTTSALVILPNLQHGVQEKHIALSPLSLSFLSASLRWCIHESFCWRLSRRLHHMRLFQPLLSPLPLRAAVRVTCLILFPPAFPANLHSPLFSALEFSFALHDNELPYNLQRFPRWLHVNSFTESSFFFFFFFSSFLHQPQCFIICLTIISSNPPTSDLNFSLWTYLWLMKIVLLSLSE